MPFMFLIVSLLKFLRELLAVKLNIIYSNIVFFFLNNFLIIPFELKKKSSLKQVKTNKVTVGSPKKPFFRKVIFSTRISHGSHPNG